MYYYLFYDNGKVVGSLKSRYPSQSSSATRVTKEQYETETGLNTLDTFGEGPLESAVKKNATDIAFLSDCMTEMAMAGEQGAKGETGARGPAGAAGISM